MTSALHVESTGILWYDELDSTQDELFRLADEQAEDGLIVAAKCQRTGRGRRGRPWLSPEGGLYFSILLRDVDRGKLPLLPLIAGLALHDTFSPITTAPLFLKWPNDLFVESRKLAGVLSEHRGDTTVIGVGVNLNGSPLPSAASLADIVNIEQPEPNEIIDTWREHFHARRLRSNTATEVDSRLYGKDRAATHDGNRITIRQVANDGSLVVEKNGKSARIRAGEIIYDLE